MHAGCRVHLVVVVVIALLPVAAPWLQQLPALLRASGRRLSCHAPTRPCDGATRTFLVASAVEARQRARTLVSTQWLQDRIDQGAPDLVVLDVRGQVGKRDVGAGRVETTYEALAGAFAEEHIPGAVFVDWTRDIVDLYDDSAPVQLAPLDVFAGAMEEKGVGTDKTVVIYDTGKMLFATRLWWALTIYGHEDVRILDGGWKRWTHEGRDTESGVTTCPLKLHASFAAREAWPMLRCGAPDVQQLLPSLQLELQAEATVGSEKTPHQLIDARGKVQFDGLEMRAARGGRIPGAVNVPYKVLIDAAAGGYLPLQQMRQELQARGVFLSDDAGASSADLDNAARETVIYCNGGVASTAVLFAMWQLGVPLARLSNYDGSWGEWGNQDDEASFPVEV